MSMSLEPSLGLASSTVVEDKTDLRHSFNKLESNHTLAQNEIYRWLNNQLTV